MISKLTGSVKDLYKEKKELLSDTNNSVSEKKSNDGVK